MSTACGGLYSCSTPAVKVAVRFMNHDIIPSSYQPRTVLYVERTLLLVDSTLYH